MRAAYQRDPILWRKKVNLASKCIAAAGIFCAIISQCWAQQKITIGGTPNSGPATAMVADTEGIFQKHGLEATYT